MRLTNIFFKIEFQNSPYSKVNLATKIVKNLFSLIHYSIEHAQQNELKFILQFHLIL